MALIRVSQRCPFSFLQHLYVSAWPFPLDRREMEALNLGHRDAVNQRGPRPFARQPLPIMRGDM